MIHSGYSFRHAVGSLADVISRLKEIGWAEAPISDRASTFAHVKWDRLTKAAGLRPVYGVSLGVSARLGDKRPAVDWWRLLAKTKLECVHDALHLATKQPGEALLSRDAALEMGGLVKIMGSRCLIDFVEPAEDLYLALSPSTPKGLCDAALRKGHRLVAVSDNCYPRAEDLRMYLAVLGWRGSDQTYARHVLSDDELRRECWHVSDEVFADAVETRRKILSECRAEVRHATLIQPEKALTLREMCEDGAARKGCDLSDPVYAERLDRELRIIDEKKFQDYFYVVSDLLRWSRERMICGPGRGSSSGSLVCWLLDITAVDPIKFDLVFERFIDVTRADYPDIDIDLSDERRELAFEYLKQKYGREKVARLATVLLFQSKSALNQIGAAIGVPKWMIENTVNSVITRSKGDSRADYKVEDTFKITEAGKKLIKEYPEMALAGRIEGHPVTSGQHSAGVVMTAGSVREVVGVSAHNDVAMCDWQDAKDIDLLKIDVLGLTQLSIFERCLKMVGLPDRGAFLETLPLDDADALDVLNKRHLAGVFQFQGGTTRQVVHQLNRVTEFEDVVSITALCRPGPLGSGGTQSWINRKNGTERVEVIHPAFWKYLKKTMGIMVYQEQVMRICREIGGMSWGDVTSLRKAMGKSMGMEYFDSYRAKYLPGALEHGVPEDAARKMWDGMCSFGMYGFNRAHAVAYGLITYWCCWLKAHHPVEFAAATLDAEGDPAKQIDVLRELRDEGTDYVAVDLERSTERWSVETRGNRKVLIGPLTLVKGIGPAAVRKIMASRSGGDEPMLPGMAKKILVPKTEIDSLYPIAEAFRKMYPSPQAAGFRDAPIPVSKVFDTRKGKSAFVVGVLVRNHPLNENEPGRIARRGYEIKNDRRLEALNFHLRDDSGDIFCKVSRFEYPKLGPVLIDGRPGKSMFAIYGTVPEDFRMIWVRAVKYLGEMDGQERRLGATDEQRRAARLDAEDVSADRGAEAPQVAGVHQRDERLL